MSKISKPVYPYRHFAAGQRPPGVISKTTIVLLLLALWGLLLPGVTTNPPLGLGSLATACSG